VCEYSYKLFHRTDNDTDFLADFRAKKSTCPTHAVVGYSTTHADLSVQCLSVTHFSSRGYALGMCTFTRVCVLYVHDKLSFTRLHNYTIDKSVLVSVLLNCAAATTHYDCALVYRDRLGL